MSVYCCIFTFTFFFIYIIYKKMTISCLFFVFVFLVKITCKIFLWFKNLNKFGFFFFCWFYLFLHWVWNKIFTARNFAISRSDKETAKNDFVARLRNALFGLTTKLKWHRNVIFGEKKQKKKILCYKIPGLYP